MTFQTASNFSVLETVRNLIFCHSVFSVLSFHTFSWKQGKERRWAVQFCHIKQKKKLLRIYIGFVIYLYSPRLGWAVFTNIPQPEWQIVSNIHLEKLIKMLELSKIWNQALCFGNFLILIREFGRLCKLCGGRALACETHLCHVGKEAEHLPLGEECETTKTPPLPPSPLTHFRELSGSCETGTWSRGG